MQGYMTYMTYLFYMTYMSYMPYMSYMTYMTYMTYTTYMAYMTYTTYMTYIMAYRYMHVALHLSMPGVTVREQASTIVCCLQFENKQRLFCIFSINSSKRDVESCRHGRRIVTFRPGTAGGETNRSRAVDTHSS